MKLFSTPLTLSDVFSPIARGKNSGASFAKAKPAVNLHVFELLVLFVTLTSIVSLIFLIIGHFHSLTALLTSLLVFIASLFIFRIKITIKDVRFHIGLWIVLVVALVFRYQPYLYLSGGQDEGLYVNASVQYEKQGKIICNDSMCQQLNDDQKKIYDGVGNIYVEGITAFKNSTYLMPFYPLHPLWLAIFGKLLGSDNRVYSLLFFSLLSITAFYLLAFEISGRKLPAFLTGLFFAVNPLMAFVSKMPFSEITSLAFVSLSVYYFVRFIKTGNKNGGGAVYLVLSFLLFNCFFYTRMSAFMYLPYLCFLALASVLYLPDKVKLKHLLVFTFSIFLFYALSLLFYSHFIPPLYAQWLRAYIVGPLGVNWPLKLIIGLLSFVVLLFLANIISKYETGKHWLKRAFNYLLPTVLLVLLGVAIYKFYKLGFTGVMVDNFFGYGNQGIRDIRVTAIYNYFLYLSPIGFLAFFLMMLSPKGVQDNATRFVGLFILMFLFYLVIFIRVPYQYYYARYLSTEVIPFGLLLVALFIGAFIYQARHRLIKLIAYLAIAGIVSYFILFSCFQFQGVEGAKADALKRLKERVGEKALLFFHEPYYFTYSYIGIPLKYYYNLNTIRLTNPKDYSAIPYFVKCIGDKYDRIYLMTPDKMTNSNLFSEVDIVTYRHGFYFNGYHQHFNDNQMKPYYQSTGLPFYRFLIPTRYYIWKREYNLYEVTAARGDLSRLAGLNWPAQ